MVPAPIPSRKLSNLISIFEQPTSNSISATATNSTIPISARFVRPGAVSENVRRFSVNSMELGDILKGSNSNGNGLEKDDLVPVMSSGKLKLVEEPSSITGTSEPPLPVVNNTPKTPTIHLSKFKPQRMAPPAPLVPTIMIPAHVKVRLSGKNRVEMVKSGKKKINSVEKVIQEIKVEGESLDIRLEEVKNVVKIDGPREGAKMVSTWSSNPIDNPFESPYDSPDLSISTTSLLYYPPRPKSQPNQSFTKNISSTRPLLIKNGSSSTISTIQLAATTIFGTNADPLILPHLDEYLATLPKPHFSPLNQKGLFSPSEMVVWNEWTREKVQESNWIAKLFNWFTSSSEKYVDVEKQKLIISDKTLIVPPFHLIDGTTVSNLKANKEVPFLTSDAVWGSLIDGILAIEGSDYGLSLTNLESFRDAIQVLSLLMQRTSPNNTSKAIYISRFLAGDFASTFGYALVWLAIFSVISFFFFAIYEIYRFSGGWKGIEKVKSEGLDQESECLPCQSSFRDEKKYKTFITFLATTIYLPLSKLALDGIVWSSDYWISTFKGIDPDTIFTSSTEFCYKTGYDSSHFHFANFIIFFSALVMLVVSVFLPYRLYRIAELYSPKIDEYTSIGTKRIQKTFEYERLLWRDRSSFSFLYTAYKKDYSYFKSIYLLIKLLVVTITVIFNKNNCIFYGSNIVGYFRQGFLLLFMIIFLITSLFTNPFISQLTNSSDNLSRFSFVVISFLGLLAVFQPSSASVLTGGVTMFVVILAYLFNVYFTIISLDWTQSKVKRLQNRVDLSLDIFSPCLDLDKHINQRIWRETLSVILLTSQEYRMSSEQTLEFQDLAGSPYLLSFGGSQAERLVENIKILREIGLESYQTACEVVDEDTFIFRKIILKNLTGPDIAFTNHKPLPPGVSSIFGRVDISPFPFVVIFRYDQDPSNPIKLSTKAELHHLIKFNNSIKIQERRKVRQSLRALNNQFIYAPIEILGTRYQSGLLKIHQNADCLWHGTNFSSGFKITISYNDGITRDGKKKGTLVQNGYDLGISDDLRSNHAITKLFRNNRKLLESRIDQVLRITEEHRDWFRNEIEWKYNTMSYHFLLKLFEKNLSKVAIERILSKELGSKLQDLVKNHSASIIYLEERMNLVTKDRVSKFWYLLWDEIYRQNGLDLNLPEINFSPHYRNSICYSILPRAQLKSFLLESGVIKYFDNGFLNKIYFYLDETIYSNTSKAIPIRIDDQTVEFFHLPSLLINQTCSDDPPITTSAGTNFDDPIIRLRKGFSFEELYDQPTPLFINGQRSLWMKWWWNEIITSLKIWSGLIPVEHSRTNHDVKFELRKSQAGWEISRDKSSF